jgi:hypothetical protein
MSRLLAVFIIFSILVGSCCTGAFSAFAFNSHHQNSLTTKSIEIHDKKHNHANHHENSNDLSENSNDPCDHNSLDCSQQIAINSFSEKLPKNVISTGEKEYKFYSFSNIPALQSYSKRSQFTDRFIELQSTIFHSVLRQTKRLRL